MQQLFESYTQVAYTHNAMVAAPMTVVETERFLKDTKLLMSDAERAVLGSSLGRIRSRAKSFLDKHFLIER